MQSNKIFEIYRHLSMGASSSTPTEGIYTGELYIELYNPYSGGYVHTNLMYNGHSKPSSYDDTGWYQTARDGVTRYEITTFVGHTDKNGEFYNSTQYTDGQYAWVVMGVDGGGTAFGEVPAHGFCYYSTTATVPWEDNIEWTCKYAGKVYYTDTRYIIEVLRKAD